MGTNAHSNCTTFYRTCCIYQEGVRIIGAGQKLLSQSFSQKKIVPIRINLLSNSKLPTRSYCLTWFQTPLYYHQSLLWILLFTARGNTSAEHYLRVSQSGNPLYTSGTIYENQILGHPLFFSADPAFGDRGVDPAGLSQSLCCREPFPAPYSPGEADSSLMDVHPPIHAIHLDAHAIFTSGV